MIAPSDARKEWERGWPIVVGAALASGFGIPLFYHVFSLFTLHLADAFKMSRGELANMQALIVAGALTAPLIGRWLDRRGFRHVFTLCSIAIIATHLLMAGWVEGPWQFAFLALLYGAAGIGGGPLAYTRPLNAWFWHNRGMALGLAALGLALTAAILPPFLAILIDREGWRAGFLALAILTTAVSLPAGLLLVRNEPPEGRADTPTESQPMGERSHLRERDFWVMVIAMLCMAIPGSGMVSQIATIVQEEGVAAQAAAYGIAAYAIGQLVGRIVAGWLLDQANPRLVAFLFTALPALGFVFLTSGDVGFWLAILAVGLVGIQQGAEIDLFAYFTSRRFGLLRYGSIYGGIIAASWVGNAAGILLFGWLHDATSTYRMAEALAAGMLFAGAILIILVPIRGTANIIQGAE